MPRRLLSPAPRRGAVDRGSDDPHFAGGRRHVDRQSWLRANLRDANEGGDGAVTHAARFVGHHADGDDVVAGREGREIG